MSGWLPGRLYRATVRGVPDVLVYRDALDELWFSVTLVDDVAFHPDAQVTDVRGPLYVLELDEQDARRVARELTGITWLAGVGRQVAAQIPEPPRMAERGWGSKVRSRVAGVHGNQACIWLRAWPDPRGYYICQHGLIAPWSDLIDPEPVGGES